MPDLTKLFLFQRNNGYYYIGYIEDGRKHWKSTKCRRKADALKALTNFKGLVKSKPSSKTLSEYVKEFLPYVEGSYSKATATIYRSTLQRFLTLVGDRPIQSLTPRHADTYKVERMGEVSPVSVNIELRSLRAAFNVAVRWRHIEKNPFDDLKPARTPEVSPAYLSRQDFQKLLETMNDHWLKDLVVFAVATGTRRGEMLNLRWQDVDLERRLIQIKSSEKFRTKSGRNRSLPMSDAVASILKRRTGRSHSEYIFSRKGRRIGESFLTHRFKRFVRDAGMDEGLHWHSLRHTHASWLVQEGVSLYEVQKLLGHSAISVTEIYSHLQPSVLLQTVNRLDCRLWNNGEVEADTLAEKIYLLSNDGG